MFLTPTHSTSQSCVTMNITVTDPESSCKYFLYRTVGSADQVAVEAGFKVELETKAIRRFAKVSIVSYSRPSLMIIASASQFYVYLLVY